MNRQKWIEGTKVIYHPAWLRRFREDPFSVPPIYIEISPVGQCNHRCTFCAPEMLGYVNRQLDVHLLNQRFREMREMRELDADKLGVKAIQFAGEGEPTLHKDLAAIIKLARDNGIDAGMLTNATGLTERLSNQIVPLVNGYIQASINAGTRDSYAMIHQTGPEHWDLIWKNLAKAVKIREMSGTKECDLGANMTVLIEQTKDDKGRAVPPNWPEVELLIQRSKDIGLDYVSFKPYSQHLYSEATAKRYGKMSYKEMMDEIYEIGQKLLEKYSDDNFEAIFRFSRFEEYEAENRGYTTCRATPTIWSYIQSDGLWISCSAYWTDPRFALGNIKTQTVREIWYGESRRRHLDFVLNHLDISECRKTCHPDKENVFLNKMTNMNDGEFNKTLVRLEGLPKPKRANFI